MAQLLPIIMLLATFLMFSAVLAYPEVLVRMFVAVLKALPRYLVYAVERILSQMIEELAPILISAPPAVHVNSTALVTEANPGMCATPLIHVVMLAALIGLAVSNSLAPASQ
eukprot:922411-Karenia_brevis.AAC.1